MTEQFAMRKTRSLAASALMLLQLSLVSMQYAQDPVAPPQEHLEPLQQHQMQDMCNAICNSCRDILQQVDCALEQVALIINNNQAPKINKKTVLPHILQLRQTIKPLKDNKIAAATMEYTVSFIKITNALTRYVSTAIYEEFANIESFNLSALITRSSISSDNIEDLLESMQKTAKRAERLQDEAENIGLNFFNKAYRKAEKLNHKYKIVRKLMWTSLAAAIGSYIIYRSNPSWFTKNPFSKANNPDTKGNDNAAKVTPEQPKTREEIMSILLEEAFRKQLEEGDVTVETFAQYLTAQQILEKNQVKAAAEKLVEGNFFLAKLKRILGHPPDKNGHSQLPGFWTYTEDFLTRTLSLVAFSGPVWFVLPEYAKEPVVNWSKRQWEYIKKKASQLASFLRGAPIKRVMNAYEKEIKCNFDDIIGNDDAKEKLWPIIDYMIKYEQYDKAGIVPMTGILLIGAPRTGKTFIAEAMAGEMKKLGLEQIKIVPLNAAEVKALGTTKVFDFVTELSKEIGPVILVIDEIDTGGFLRSGENADNQALCELLTALSNLNRQKERKIVVIACTNKPENIDPALLEAGRFGCHIYFNYPWCNERKEYLSRELRNRTIDIEEDFIDYLAILTENCSFDALNQILTAALQKAKNRGSALAKEDLMMAFYQEIDKISFVDLPIPEEEQQIIAIHQAAQAFCRIALQTKQQVTLATTYAVNPDITQEMHSDDNINSRSLKKNKMQYGKVFTIHQQDTLSGELKGQHFTASIPKFFTHDDYVKEIKVLLAGHIAEKIINGTAGYIYCKHDQEQALNIAKYMSFKGLVEQEWPKAYKQEKLTEALHIINQCQDEVEKLLRDNIEQLLALANALYNDKILTGHQMISVLDQSHDGTAQTDDDADDEDQPAEIQTNLQPA